MTESLYAACLEALQADLASTEQLTIYLSGGSTPRDLYHKLAQAALPWDRIHPALVDERWVSTDDKASNEGMLRNLFAANDFFVKQLTGMYTGPGSHQAAVATCSDKYQQLPECISFCILGMGADGHTASLFPYAHGLDIALATTLPCAAITAQPSAVTGPQTERMSLSLSGILRAKRIFLMFTGDAKLDVYRQALAKNDPARYPVCAILHQQLRKVEIFYCP